MARPTKYKKEYCALLIEHMKEGYSLDSFAGKVEVNQDTIYEWLKKYEEFKIAKEYGLSLSLLWWESKGMEGMTGRIIGFNPTLWIFNMKNRFKWKDVHETKIELEVDYKKQITLINSTLGLANEKSNTLGLANEQIKISQS